MRADVFIVGGGPAGLATAIAARMKGFDVVVADAARPPVDKACGEGILPGGVHALRRLGLDLCGEGGFPIHGIRFIDGSIGAEVKFQSGHGIALRRTRLHQILADRASELGVRLLWGARVTNAQAPWPHCWIIGADGQNSRIRTAAGLDAPTYESRRFGFRRHYLVRPWTDMVEVHWGPKCQIYVTPISDREVGVAVLSGDPHIRLNDALRFFPEVQSRLHSAEPSTSEHGGLTVSRRLRRVFRENTVLVGDASGSVDAITGEGLSVAFNQAIALSEALWRDDPGSYQLAHSRLARRPAMLANALMFCARCRWARRTVFRALDLMRPTPVAKLLTDYASNPACNAGRATGSPRLISIRGRDL